MRFFIDCKNGSGFVINIYCAGLVRYFLLFLFSFISFLLLCNFFLQLLKRFCRRLLLLTIFSFFVIFLCGLNFRFGLCVCERVPAGIFHFFFRRLLFVHRWVCVCAWVLGRGACGCCCCPISSPTVGVTKKVTLCLRLLERSI